MTNSRRMGSTHHWLRYRRTAEAIGVVITFSSLPCNAQPAQRTVCEVRNHNLADPLWHDGKIKEAVAVLEAVSPADCPGVSCMLAGIFLPCGEYRKAHRALQACLGSGASRVEQESGKRLLEMLETDEGAVWLKIDVTPANATVVLDGEKLTNDEMSAGVQVRRAQSHYILASANGFTSHDVELGANSVSKKGSRPHVVAIQLTRPEPAAPPPPTLAQVALACAIPDAQVAVDAQPVAPSRLSTPLLLSAAPHKFEFSRPGYISDAQTVEVRPNSLQTVSCKLEPDPHLPAEVASTLDLRGKPSDAVAAVDGKEFQGTDAPVVPKGKHQLEVRLAGYTPWARTVDLVAGSNPIAVDLSPNAETRQRHQRNWAVGLAAVGAATTIATIVIVAVNNGRYDNWSKEDRAIAQSATAQWNSALAERESKNNHLLNSVHNVDKLGVGLGVASAALLGAGIGLYFSAPTPSRESTSPAQATLHWRARW